MKHVEQEHAQAVQRHAQANQRLDQIMRNGVVRQQVEQERMVPQRRRDGICFPGCPEQGRRARLEPPAFALRFIRGRTNCTRLARPPNNGGRVRGKDKESGYEKTIVAVTAPRLFANQWATKLPLYRSTQCAASGLSCQVPWRLSHTVACGR